MTHPLEAKHGDVFRPINGSWSGHDAVRHHMYADLERILSGVVWEDRPYSLLEFGTLEPTSSIIRILVYLMGERLRPEICNYPEVNIELTPYSDSQWDILVVDQVLEHVERPWLAAEEIWRILKPGGYAVVNTPYLHPIHKCPLDCWRISPDGYKVLFPKERFETVGNGMWGNRKIIEQLYHSNVIRGMTGDWLSVVQAETEVPAWREATDNLNPVVVWNVFRKL